MSKYTTQVRWIVEHEQETVPFKYDERYTDKTYRKLGLDEYPIFEESYRQHLNDKIIDHFYFREIGFETVAQFSWYMRRTMNEIMPYFNEMYIAQMKIDDPLNDFSRNWREDWDMNLAKTGNIADVFTADNSEVLDGTVLLSGEDEVVYDDDSSNNTTNIYQDTPMSLLSNVGSPSVEDMDYATNVTYNLQTGMDDSTTTTTYGKQTDTDNTVTTTKEEENNKTFNTNDNDIGWKEHKETGRNKSQAALMKEYLDMFVNIDMKVIERLEDLFMGLW